MSDANGSITVQASELRYDLSPEDVDGYFKMIAPQGISCMICQQQSWGAGIVEGKTQDGKIARHVFPDGILNHSELEGDPADPQLNLRNPNRTYSFTCGNCGYRLTFLAGMVAARIAISKRTREQS